MTAGVASASVGDLAAKDKLLSAEMPMAKQSAGYPNNEVIDIAMLGMKIERNLDRDSGLLQARELILRV